MCPNLDMLSLLAPGFSDIAVSDILDFTRARGLVRNTRGTRARRIRIIFETRGREAMLQSGVPGVIFKGNEEFVPPNRWREKELNAGLDKPAVTVLWPLRHRYNEIASMVFEGWLEAAARQSCRYQLKA